MKTITTGLGVVLVFFGSIWFLQGIDILPGSFMSGQIKWAVYGGIAVVSGIVLLVVSRRGLRPGSPPKPP